MKVYVYKNIRRKDWSVKALEGPDKGRVIGHEVVVALRDVEFRVGEAGRRRVLREQRKNVHAGAVGQLVNAQTQAIPGEIVSYNPYRGASFYRVADGSDIAAADSVLFGNNGKVYADNPR